MIKTIDNPLFTITPNVKSQYKKDQTVYAKETIQTTFPSYVIPGGCKGKVYQVFGSEIYEVQFFLYGNQYMTVGVFGNQIGTIQPLTN